MDQKLKLNELPPITTNLTKKESKNTKHDINDTSNIRDDTKTDLNPNSNPNSPVLSDADSKDSQTNFRTKKCKLIMIISISSAVLIIIAIVIILVFAKKSNNVKPTPPSFEDHIKIRAYLP